jgi:hypothetical protein
MHIYSFISASTSECDRMNNKVIDTPIEAIKIEQEAPRVVNGQTDLQSKLRNLLGIYVNIYVYV